MKPVWVVAVMAALACISAGAIVRFLVRDYLRSRQEGE